MPFAYLGTDVVSRVVEKFVLQLELQLADQNVHIQFDSDAREWLGARGYDRLYGARPMARLIQDKVKLPLAEELLFGKLRNGGEVHVSLKDNALSFEMTPAPPKLGKVKKVAAEPASAKPTSLRKSKAAGGLKIASEPKTASEPSDSSE